MSKNRGKDKVYKCPTTNKNNISEMILKKDEIESIFIKHLVDIIKIKDIDRLWSDYEEEVKEEIENTKAAIKDLEQKLSEFIEKQKQVKIFYHNLTYSEKVSKENDEESFDTVLKDQLGELDVVLRKKKDICKNLIQQQEEYLESFITSKEKFEEIFSNILIKFDQLNNPPKRMIVEYLVGKIVVNKNEHDEIQIDIIINPPKILG